MAKKSRRNFEAKPDSNRQAKLAARAAEREELAGNPRPFAGVVGECDIVAMQQFVPSATAKVELAGVDHPVYLSTVLPGAIAALTRAIPSGTESFVGLQTAVYGLAPERDLAASLAWVAKSEAGDTLQAADPTDEDPELAELLKGNESLEVTVHDNFAWWAAEGAEVHPQIAQAIQHANGAMMPSARIDTPGADAAWWVDAGERAHIRWVRPEDEDALFDAMARLHNRGELTLGAGSSFAGSFRTTGLLVPVFDLDNTKAADHWTDGLATLDAKFTEALAETGELSSEERASRNGLRARQVTLR